MGAGANIGSAIAGFAKGFSGQMAEGWQREREARIREDARKDREFQTLLPIHLQLAQDSGDYRGVEEWIGQYDPALAKRLKKDMPLSRLAPLFNWQQGGQATSAAVPPATTTSNTDPNSLASMLGQEPPTSTETLPSRNPASPDVESPGQRPGSTFFGTPVLTDAEKANRQFDARRNVARKAGLDPKAASEFGLYGDRPPVTQARAAAPSEFDDFVAAYAADKGLRPEQLSAADRLEARKKYSEVQRAPAGQTPTTASEFDDFLTSYAAEKGKKPEQLTVAERLDARTKFTTAGRAPQQETPGGGDPAALARLAIRNPAILTGSTMTPTLKGAVLSAISADPVMRTQYEAARMAPVREHATAALETLKQLVVVDPATGKAMLTDGAKSLFGEWTPASMRGVMPGKDATDANAALQQLISQQILDTIAVMKEQSASGATGFGQMNVKELNVLSSAATKLAQRLSEDTAAKELGLLVEKLTKVLQPSLIETPAGGAAVSKIPLSLDTPIFIGPDGRPQVAPPGAP